MSESKDTIYIDVDEEITGIISKVQKSPKDIVALVLPKRASVLQSVVNMKLLKRAQEQHGKKIVLITSEARILPLAGSAGLFVASNLTSKPYVPPLHKAGDAKPVADEEGAIDPNTPVSQVAPAAKFADSDDEIQIDNTPKTPEPGAQAAAKKSKKKSMVPNFSKFRKKVIIIALIVLLLIFGLIYAIFMAPKAKITLKAQTDSLPVSVDFTADPNAQSLDSDNKVVRESVQNTQKDNSEKVNASGQKDKGTKATGNVTFSIPCSDVNGSPPKIPAGTGISADNLTYITQSSVTLDNPSFSPCTFTGSTTVKAQDNGDQYNSSARAYTVNVANVTAQGSAMSGGTSKIVKVVSQTDVDKAKERLNGAPNTAHDDFKAQLEKDGYIPIEDSFKSKAGKYDISPAVGQEADQVTVSTTTTYSMIGVKKEDLQQLVKDAVGQQDAGKDKSILSDGLDNATFKISGDIGSDGHASVNISTTVVVGPNIDQENIKNQIAGKKSGEAQQILGQVPGVNDPQVQLSPFWVGKVPKKHSKITIEVQQADGSQIP